MKPRYDAQGKLNFWMVLPSSSLADLVVNKLCQQYPELNYVCRWKDVQGAGLNLTVAPWVRSGQVYTVPD